MIESRKESDPRVRASRGSSIMLRCAIEEQQSGQSPDDGTQRALRSLCRDARENGLLVEQLIHICKDAWRTLPEARGLSREMETATLSRVISLCITEYYATDGAPGPSTPEAEAAASREESISFLPGRVPEATQPS